jgi:Domain of unknown function (DUF4224)
MPTFKTTDTTPLQPGFVTYEALKELTGYERRSDIERLLQSQGIRFFYSRYGLWTTMTIINNAGGAGNGDPELYDAGII